MFPQGGLGVQIVSRNLDLGGWIRVVSGWIGAGWYAKLQHRLCGSYNRRKGGMNGVLRRDSHVVQ